MGTSKVTVAGRTEFRGQLRGGDSVMASGGLGLSPPSRLRTFLTEGAMSPSLDPNQLISEPTFSED